MVKKVLIMLLGGGLVVGLSLPALAGPFVKLHKLTASDANAGDEFGFSVAISGATALVGARLDDDAGTASGSAYLYDFSDPCSITEIKLTASDAAAEDFFGVPVALSGATAIVGALGNDDACPGDPSCNSGSAYLYDFSDPCNIIETKLTASDAAADDRFGSSVALSGSTALVGASQDSDAGRWSGSAYLFDVATGGQIAKLTASDATASDFFGRSVAISGSTAIVGAWLDDDACPGNPLLCNSGSAYLYDFSDPNNIIETKLTASDAAAGDGFGYSVSLSGSTALVGARGNEAAYLYDFSDPCNIIETKLTASDAAARDFFGRSVAISSSTAIVGAYWDDDAGSDSGSAYLFDFSDPCNIIETKLTASDAAAEDFFGRSVAISGATAIAGAPGNNDAGGDSGSAYIFVREPILVDIDIDIKPGSCPNPLNVRSRGMLPVAILGSEDFDVNTIDVASVRLAGVAPIRSGYEDVAAPVFDANDCNCTEEGPDGFLDLTLKFETQRIVEAIGDVNDGDVLTLELTGVLYDETPIEGADCILIRGRHKPINPADINKDGVVNTADFAIFAQNWLQSSIVDE